EEAVEIAVGAVHPVQRLEFGPEHIGEEVDLRLHVAGVEGEVVYAVGQTHGILLSIRYVHSRPKPPPDKAALCLPSPACGGGLGRGLPQRTFGREILY